MLCDKIHGLVAGLEFMVRKAFACTPVCDVISAVAELMVRVVLFASQ